jgi:hypothetical protein
VGEVNPRGGIAQHMTCVEVGGDSWVGDEPVVVQDLPRR